MRKYENRPYIICHILSSVDGRISGSLFNAPETRQAQQVYSDIRKDYDCAAVLNGTVTCAQIYSDGYAGDLPKAGGEVVREDHIADTNPGKYVVCVDTEGVLGWHGNTVERGGQKNHVIEILTEKVPDDYIYYLRQLDISYIFAGKDALDIPLAMKKLKKLFDIDSLMITGGGMIDWSFLQEGMMDELSLVVSPVAGGEKDAASVFDRSEFALGGAVSLELSDVKKYENGILWLNYNVKNHGRA